MANNQGVYTTTITHEAVAQTLAQHGCKATVAGIRELAETHGFRAPAAEPKPQVKEEEQKEQPPASPQPRQFHKSPVENASGLPTAAAMRAMGNGNDNPAICQDGATGGNGEKRNEWRAKNNKKKRGRPRKDDAERSAKKARP